MRLRYSTQRERERITIIQLRNVHGSLQVHIIQSKNKRELRGTDPCIRRHYDNIILSVGSFVYACSLSSQIQPMSEVLIVDMLSSQIL